MWLLHICTSRWRCSNDISCSSKVKIIWFMLMFESFPSCKTERILRLNKETIVMFEEEEQKRLQQKLVTPFLCWLKPDIHNNSDITLTSLRHHTSVCSRRVRGQFWSNQSGLCYRGRPDGGAGGYTDLRPPDWPVTDSAPFRARGSCPGQTVRTTSR